MGGGARHERGRRNAAVLPTRLRAEPEGPLRPCPDRARAGNVAAMISELPDRTLVLDGGLATELERRGADLNDPLWSARLLVEDPAAIEAVHRAYFEAGADLAISASYQAGFEGFAARGIGRDAAAELMRSSVRLALEARDAFDETPRSPDIGDAPGTSDVGDAPSTSDIDDAGMTGAGQRSTTGSRVRPLVAASVGPYGAALADGSEYRGDYGVSRGRLEDFHAPRLAVLADADTGVDLLAIETIPSLEEALLLVRLLEDLPDARAWISFTCRDAEHVAHGERFADCVAAVAASPQVLAVGLNCTAPRFVEPLLRAARRATPKPLVAYPNRGERWDADAHRWFDADEGAGSPEAFAELALRWRDAGASLIGGCCRTGPEHVRALRAVLADD